MKTRITLLALGGLLMLAGSAAAQTVYDAAKFIDKDLNGTARFVSMGGAMSALGGDISTMNTNPAGIGIYRSNDIQTTFGLSSYNSKSNTLSGTFKNNDVRGDFNQIGFVYSAKIGNSTPLRYVNFGFNYRRLKSFYNKQKFAGGLGDFTQTLQMAQQADGIKYDAWDNAFNNDEIGWLSAIGYYGGVIEPAGYNEEYIGMYDQGNGLLEVEQRGHLDQYSFNMAFNINDRVYLGLTMGGYDLNFKKYTYYVETYPDTNSEGYDLSSWNRIVGTGIDFKLGAIVLRSRTHPSALAWQYTPQPSISWSTRPRHCSPLLWKMWKETSTTTMWIQPMSCLSVVRWYVRLTSILLGCSTSAWHLPWAVSLPSMLSTSTRTILT